MGGAIGSCERRLDIVRTENGWIVTVYNPPGRYVDPQEKMFKALATVLPAINRAGGRGFMEGADEAHEPWKAGSEDRAEEAKQHIALAQKAVNEAFDDKGPLHKPVETHVFIDHAKMLEFVGKAMALEGRAP